VLWGAGRSSGSPAHLPCSWSWLRRKRRCAGRDHRDSGSPTHAARCGGGPSTGPDRLTGRADDLADPAAAALDAVDEAGPCNGADMVTPPAVLFPCRLMGERERGTEGLRHAEKGGQLRPARRGCPGSVLTTSAFATFSAARQPVVFLVRTADRDARSRCPPPVGQGASSEEVAVAAAPSP
jgi:hypothetical protein